MSLIRNSKQPVVVASRNRFSHYSDSGLKLTVSTKVDEEFIAARYGLYPSHRLYYLFDSINNIRLTFHESIVKMLISKVKSKVREICQKLLKK